MIVVDENIENSIIHSLINCGYPVTSIKEVSPGISDWEVAHLAETQNGVIITADKDFGEIAFAQKGANIRVILLRYNKTTMDDTINTLHVVLSRFYPPSSRFFITIKGAVFRKSDY